MTSIRVAGASPPEIRLGLRENWRQFALLMVINAFVGAMIWGWVVFANVLLGINQGLCWSTTVIVNYYRLAAGSLSLALAASAESRLCQPGRMAD